MLQCRNLSYNTTYTHRNFTNLAQRAPAPTLPVARDKAFRYPQLCP